MIKTAPRTETLLKSLCMLNDGFNKLILLAELDWREISVSAVAGTTSCLQQRPVGSGVVSKGELWKSLSLVWLLIGWCFARLTLDAVHATAPLEVEVGGVVGGGGTGEVVG